jgi:hypothetical protein
MRAVRRSATNARALRQFCRSDAERYVASRVRDGEPLSWMHRRALAVIERRIAQLPAR